MDGKDNFTSKLDDLNKAIDDNDMSKIEMHLEQLSADQPFPHEIEDSQLFARRIIRQNQKGYDRMKKSSISRWSKVAVCLLLVFALGATAGYAAGYYKSYKFYSEQYTIDVRTTGELSEEEARGMAKEAEANFEDPGDNVTIIEPERLTFASIEEAEEKLDITIAKPTVIPEGYVMEEEIYVEKTSDTDFNAYVSYVNEKEDYLGITIIKMSLEDGSTHVTLTDTVFEDTFSSNGIPFTLMKEDEGLIAAADFGDIQYAIVSFGLSEKDLKEVVNSIDLSIYK